MNKIIIFFLLIFSLTLSMSYSQPSVDGSWNGSISIVGSELGILVKFETGPDSLRATIDIPQQRVKDLKLIHASYSFPKIYFELPATQGTAVFDGTFSSDSIKGLFTQVGLNGTFYLVRGEQPKEESKKDTVVLPYKEEEVTFNNNEISFSGTLTIPETKGKHPAVVMITGSGSHNRDEDLLGFKVFKIIADHFTRNGIAVLRYDDRGVGKSTGNQKMTYTSKDFAGDVIEAVNYLKSREDINPSQIGLCGHSEGGIVAPLAATESSDIAFIILMAGPGVKGIDILKEQSKLIMLANGATDEEVKENTRILDKTYEAVTTVNGWGVVDSLIKVQAENSYDKMTEEQKKGIKDKDEFIKNIVSTHVSTMKIPWMEFFMKYDPAPALEKVKCPVLMLYGEKDMQVPPSQNKEPMKNALSKGGNNDFTQVLIPSANHLFQSAETGNPSEYGKLPKEFAPGFLDAMTKWILKHVTVIK